MKHKEMEEKLSSVIKGSLQPELKVDLEYEVELITRRSMNELRDAGIHEIKENLDDLLGCDPFDHPMFRASVLFNRWIER